MIPTVVRSCVVGRRRVIIIYFYFYFCHNLLSLDYSTHRLHSPQHFRSGVPHTPFQRRHRRRRRRRLLFFFDARTLRRTSARRPCRWINRLLFLLLLFTIRLVTVCSNLTV